jgi:hypothetical protein
MKCQVIRIGSVAIPGDLSILGGAGYSGIPSTIDYQCNSPDVVEVYINDRDPDTGKTRWSSPDSCLGVGDSIPTAPGNTYDLRGISIVGGKTKPFVLGFEETSADEPTQNEAPYITGAPGKGGRWF